MFVLRSCGVVGLGLFAACVGPNPAWDGAADAVPDVGDGASEEGSSSSPRDGGETTSGDGVIVDGSGSEGADSGAETTSATSTTTGAGPQESSGAGDEGPICEEGQALCDGECKDIAKDKHACGVECIDCTALFDNHARCTDGECEGDGEAEGKGDG